MYYKGCFFTKNPSQALSGKMNSQRASDGARLQDDRALLVPM